jgi:hypothetical protein
VRRWISWRLAFGRAARATAGPSLLVTALGGCHLAAGIRCDHVVAESSDADAAMGSGGGAAGSGAQGGSGGAAGGAGADSCAFEVTELALGPPGPVRLTTDESSIYWISDIDGTVAMVSKQPPSAPAQAVTLATSPTTPAYLTGDVDRLFWTTRSTTKPADSAVYRVAKAGGELECVWQENSSGVSPLGGIAIHGADLLFARPAWSAVARAPKLGDCLTPADGTQAAYPVWPTAVVVHDGGAFFIDRPPGEAASIRRVDADATTGDGEQLATDLAQPAALAVDDSGVYFSTETGDISRYARGAVVWVHRGPGGAHIDLALDDTFVYASNDDAGSVVAIRKDDAKLVCEIASAQNEPRGLVADASGVYWGNHGGNTIMHAHRR